MAVKDNRTVGVGHIEKENAKQFRLGQNYPNPCVNATAIPLTLLHYSDVTLDLYELSGKKAATVQMNNLPAGEHSIPLNFRELGLPAANYAYQIHVRNPNGVFTDCKVLTAQK